MKNRNVISIDIDSHKNNLKSLGLSDLGIYIGRDDWTVGKKLISQLLPKDKFQKYTKQDFIDSVNTVYRLPHLTLSRDKLALFAEECDFKVTRKRDVADIIVIGDQTIKKMVQNSYSSSIDFKTLKSCYSIGKEWKNLTSDDQNCMHKQVKLIEDLYGDDCEITFTQSYYYSSTGYGEKLSIYRSYLKNYVTKQAGYLYYYPKTSFDKENLSVGMTMMANCNIDKSRTFLCLLFAVCSDNMKNSNVWNQVNFKYLRKEFEYYIDIQLSSWGHAYSNLIKKMVEDKCLTAWAASLIASVMFKNVLEGQHQVGGKDCVFSLNANDLKLKNEYLVKLVNE